MPKKSNFTVRKKRKASEGLPKNMTYYTPSEQYCVVCYQQFRPFMFTSMEWEKRISSSFYECLKITELTSESADDANNNDDKNGTVMVLPFCPQCHSKVSVLYSFAAQLKRLKEDFEALRADIAVTVVQTFTQENRYDPVDYVRRQIHDGMFYNFNLFGFKTDSALCNFF